MRVAVFKCRLKPNLNSVNPYINQTYCSDHSFRTIKTTRYRNSINDFCLRWSIISSKYGFYVSFSCVTCISIWSRLDWFTFNFKSLSVLNHYIYQSGGSDNHCMLLCSILTNFARYFYQLSYYFISYNAEENIMNFYSNWKCILMSKWRVAIMFN